jgi:tetratricopeptide (TPR) repeat protein
VPTHRLAFAYAAVLTCLLLAAGAARAADPLLGEPWERPISDGIERQERERKRTTPAAILRSARLAAARRGDATTHVVRLYLLARAYGIAGDRGSAYATYRDVLAAAPRCYFAYHDMAMLDLEATPPGTRAAEDNLRRALGIHPAYVTGYRKLAALLLEEGRYRDAVGPLRRIVELDGTDLQARFLLSQALAESGQFDAASRELDLLLRREPRNASFRTLKATLLWRRGRLDEAMGVFREIAREYPAATEPLMGFLGCLEERRQKEDEVDVEAYIWALEGLLRLERDPEQRGRLNALLDDIRAYGQRLEAGPRPEGPPSPEELLRLIRGDDAEARAAVLRYLYFQAEPPARDLLLAAMGRLSPSGESSAEVRQWSVRVLGRFGGPVFVGLLRHSLADPDPAVPPVVVDALLQIAAGASEARGAVLLILGLHAESADGALAVAAQRGVEGLAKANLPAPAEDTDAARREAFRSWWNGPVASEAQVEALGRFVAIQDKFPEDVLLPYLRSADPHVMSAAWSALAAAASAVPPGPRRDWFGRLPPQRAEESPGDARRRLTAWVASRPPTR